MPLLVGTLVALAVLCPAAYCWHLHQLEKTADSLLQEASRLEEKQEFAKAAGYLHRYLRLHPDDATARVRLAKTFDKAANDGRSKWRATELHYRALGLGHDVIDNATRRDLRGRLAELLIETGQFASAEEEAEELRKANEEDPQAWRLLALALYGQFRSGALAARPQAGGGEDAVSIIKAFDRAIQLNPTEIQLATAFARICRDEDRLCTEEKEALGEAFVRTCLGGAEPSAEAKQGLDPDEQREQLADKVVDQMVTANAKSSEAYLARHLYRTEYKLGGTEDDLKSALEHGPNNVAVLLAAAEHARREAADAQQRKATADEIGKHLEEARKHYEHAIDIAREDERAYCGLGESLLAQLQVERAVEQWQQGLEKCGKDSIRLNLALADALIRYGRVDRVGRLSESEREELAGLLADKKWGLSMSQQEKLTRRLTEWLVDKPRALPGGAQRDFVNLLANKKSGLSVTDPEGLARRLSEWLVAKPPKSLEALDDVLASRAATLKPAQRIEFRRTNDLLRARWLVGKRNYSEAIPLLRGVARGGTSTETEVAQAYQARMLLAETDGVKGKWDQAAKSYEEAASLRPNLPDPRVRAAEAWNRAGRFDKAIGQYELALAAADDPEVKLQLASTQLVQQRRLPKEQRDWGLFEKARVILRDPEVQRSLDRAWRANFLEASYLLARAAEESPGDGAEAQRSRAIRDAKSLLDEAELGYPDSQDLARALVMAYEHLGFEEDADRALATFRKLTPGSADGYLLSCQLLVGRKEYDGARELVREGIRELPSEKHTPLRLVLPNISIVEGDFERAQKELLLLHREEPANADFVWRLAVLALRMDRADDLEDWEKKLKELEETEDADGVYWRYCRARRLLNEASKALEQARGTDDPELDKKARATIEDRLREAAILSANVQKQRPTWHRAHELRGRVFEQKAWLEETAQGRGRAYERAIDAYKKAIDSGAERIALYERAVPLLARLGRRAEADRCLAALKARGELSEDLLPYESASEIAAAREQGGLAEALKVARRGVDQRPTDPNAQDWYARLLLEDGHQEEAEAAFRKAIQLAPHEAWRYLALFDFYVRTRQLEQARDALQEFEDNARLRRPLDLALVVARSYERLGDLREIEAKYREAEKLAGDDITVRVAIKTRLAAIFARSDLSEAERVLREILDLAPESDAARQQLVELLAQRALATPGAQGERVWQEAQRLLQYPSSDSKASHSSRRLQAALWLARGRANNLEKAQAILEKMIEEAPGNVGLERFYLAQVYAAQSAPSRADAERYEKLRAGNNLAKADQELVEKHQQYTRLFRKSREQFIAIVARDEPNPLFLESYIDLLLLHKEALPPRLKNEAIPWLKKLETIVTQPQTDTALLNRYFALLRRHDLKDEAGQWLTKLEEVQPDSLSVLALRAQWLRDSDRASEIEPTVEQLAGRRLKALEKDGYTDPKKESQLCLAVGTIYSAVEQHQAAESWYRRHAQLLPEGYGPLAMCLTRQGRVTDAIRVCLKAAESDSSPRPAMVVASVLTSGQAVAADFQPAESLLSEATAAHKDNAQLLSAVANVRVVENRYEDAATLYRKALALNRKDAGVLNNLATLLSEDPGTRPEALRHIERAIQIVGPSPVLLDTKGTALIYDGRAKQAIPFLEQATSGPRPDPRFPFHLAVAYHQVGETAKAKATLAKALDANLEGQILTPTDKRYLSELKQKLGQ